MFVLLSSIEQSFILLPLVIGMYLSYSILKLTDLTVDGTYVLGAAVFVKTIDYGLSVALLLSIISGFVAGLMVAFMQRNGRLNSLIAGILATFMLYSINLKILGRPNISSLGKQTILSVISLETWIIPLVIIGVTISVLCFLLLQSESGLKLRAFGCNSKLLQTLGKRVEMYRTIGLALSNSLAALTGAITSQVNGFADINMGFGIALIGIGAVVIGSQIITIKKPKEEFNAKLGILSCFLGVFLYFCWLNGLLWVGVDPANIKLALGILLFFTLQKIHKGKIVK